MAVGVMGFFAAPEIRGSVGRIEFLYLGLTALAAWSAFGIFLHMRYWRHLQQYKKYVSLQAVNKLK